jgi:hypothetical protein
MTDTSYSIEGRADGFTPLFDNVVRELGTIAAVVYGVVWRHCQMRRDVCDASQGTMATLTGVAERTIRKWLRVLQNSGYIADVTDPPDIQGIPRTYVTTGKATLELSIGPATPEVNAGVSQPRHLIPTPPASSSYPPRHLVPPTPASSSAKDTSKRLSKETSRETIEQEVSSEGERQLLQHETLPPGEIPEPDPALRQLWKDEILPYLKISSPRSTYANWFKPITPIAIVGDDVLLGVNQHYECGFSARRFGKQLRRTLTDFLELERPLDFQFVASACASPVGA